MRSTSHLLQSPLTLFHFPIFTNFPLKTTYVQQTLKSSHVLQLYIPYSSLHSILCLTHFTSLFSRICINKRECRRLHYMNNDAGTKTESGVARPIREGSWKYTDCLQSEDCHSAVDLCLLRDSGRATAEPRRVAHHCEPLPTLLA